MNDYSKYSWDTWFKSLDMDELHMLRGKWIAAIKRSTGHEHDVLKWDLDQVRAEIVRRELTEAMKAHFQGRNLDGGTNAGAA
jgi:hypothetical protein